jgi:3-hydroxybutyryl-CoA dehydrogenase
MREHPLLDTSIPVLTSEIEDKTVSQIKKIGVIGAGTMGHGIAQVAAQSGLLVTLVDVVPEALERGVDRIGKGLARAVGKGRIDEALMQQALANLSSSGEMDSVVSADLVIEAVVERFDIKSSVLRDLDALCAPETILATNTSSISITKLAATTKRPDKVIGMHFMNPVPVMKLIEIIRGLATSQDTFDRIEQVSRQLGKTPVEVHDAPGFVSNRVLMPMINEAVFCLFEGVGTANAIDDVMRLGMNHPMGPLALADLIGLDVCLDILGVLYEGFRDPKYRACPLLGKMVDAGYLGRKSGRGFFTYDSETQESFHPTRGYQ